MKKETYFAPAIRSTTQEILKESDYIGSQKFFHEVFGAFSTKSQNHGIGTYSIRLLTENYLKGKVSFISNENDGTIFSVVLNKSW